MIWFDLLYFQCQLFFFFGVFLSLARNRCVIRSIGHSLVRSFVFFIYYFDNLELMFSFSLMKHFRLNVFASSHKIIWDVIFRNDGSPNFDSFFFFDSITIPRYPCPTPGHVSNIEWMRMECITIRFYYFTHTQNVI